MRVAGVRRARAETADRRGIMASPDARARCDTCRARAQFDLRRLRHEESAVGVRVARHVRVLGVFGGASRVGRARVLREERGGWIRGDAQLRKMKAKRERAVECVFGVVRGAEEDGHQG